MSDKRKRRDKLADRFGNYLDGDLALIFVFGYALTVMPWTLWRFAKLVWHVQSKPGSMGHHVAVVKMFVGYLTVWGIVLGISGVLVALWIWSHY